ncbi:MAG: ATP-binding protein [Aquihabitans sp.]
MSERRQRVPRTTSPTVDPAASPAHETTFNDNVVAASFAPDLESVSAARAFVAAQTGLAGRSQHDAALVTSELATNAVIHASTSFEVCVRTGCDRICIAVADRSSHIPELEPEKPAVTATSGRGLRIVAQLADRWGIEPSRTGKTIWAELRVSSRDRVGFSV